MIDVPSVIQPFTDAEVLVPEEKVYYRRRRHWAVLIVDTIEALTLALFFFILQVDLPRALLGIETFFFIVSAAVFVNAIVRAFRGAQQRMPIPPRFIAILFVVALVFALAVGVPVTTVVGLIVLWRFVHLLSDVIEWRWYRRLYLTNRRIIETEGLLNRRINVLPVGRITDARLDFTPLGELLDYGTFTVESAGQVQALSNIQFMRDASFFYEIAMQLATRPVELPELERFEWHSIEPDDYPGLYTWEYEEDHGVPEEGEWEDFDTWRTD